MNWLLPLFLLLSAASLAVAGEVILDNRDAAFSQAGFELAPEASAHQGDAAIASHPKGDVKASWTVDLTGRYDVHLFWGNYPGADTDVMWSVHHRGGSATQSFIQQSNPGWHFHGTYDLVPGSKVSLDFRPNQDAAIVADAVKFVPTAPRVIERVAKDTITPLTLNHGDELHFRLHNGDIRRIRLLSTSAKPVETGEQGQVFVYRFNAEFLIDGTVHKMEHIIPTQESFHLPLIVNGMRLWLDAVSDIFLDDGGFMREKDLTVGIPCRPQRKARIVVNDVTSRLCPDRLVWWYPETKDHIDVRECYLGEDVWMGTYQGRATHGGLDINMKSGTPLFAPIAIDRHYLFDSLLRGDQNNRWRGIRTWKNGAVWWLQAHHLNKMLLPDPQSLKAGEKYAETAGVAIGAREHTHFAFRVMEEGETYWLDPWLIFWQTFEDARDQ